MLRVQDSVFLQLDHESGQFNYVWPDRTTVCEWQLAQRVFHATRSSQGDWL